MLIKASFHAMIRGACATGIILGIAAGPANGAAICAMPSELPALEARVLQTELIIAALSCGEKDRYKQFVGRFERELIARGSEFKRFFTRSHGGRANTEMNALVTELANEASQRSLASSGTFCRDSGLLLDVLLKLEPKDLVRFAAERPSAGFHGVEPCIRSAGARAAPISEMPESLRTADLNAAASAGQPATVPLPVPAEAAAPTTIRWTTAVR